MKSHLVILLALLGLCSAAAASSTLNEELLAVDRTFFDAVTTTHDMKLIESMLTADFEFESNGQRKSREHFLANLSGMWEQIGPGMRMERVLVEGSSATHSTGENRALHTGVQRLYMVADGHRELLEESQFRRQLTSQEGRWKLTRESTGPVAPEENASGVPQRLVEVLTEKDLALFDAVFTTRDDAALRALLSEDFEFYHDSNGLVSTSADEFVASIRKSTDAAMQRRVVSGSVKVYPLQDFGAIQEGVHEFLVVENAEPPRLVETARFFHVWQKQDGDWKLKREFSYDHRGG
jgi:hypothetical protein